MLAVTAKILRPDMVHFAYVIFNKNGTLSVNREVIAVIKKSSPAELGSGAKVAC
jgi:hypothetical protein